MIFRRNRNRHQREDARLERAKEAQKSAEDQMREVHQLIERSKEVREEAARVREENHFIETYMNIFRGEDPPPKRRRGRLSHG